MVSLKNKKTSAKRKLLINQCIELCLLEKLLTFIMHYSILNKNGGFSIMKKIFNKKQKAASYCCESSNTIDIESLENSDQI